MSMEQVRLLEIACNEDYSNNAKWLKDNSPVWREEDLGPEAFRTACSFGLIDEARTVAWRHHLNEASVRICPRLGGPIYDPLVSACRNGQFETAEWLVAYFDPERIRDLWTGPHHWLEAAMHGGHLKVADLLVATFNMTADEVKRDKKLWYSIFTIHRSGDEAAREAKKAQALKVLEWFISRFKVTAEDIRAGYDLFGKACEEGNLQVVQRLAGLGLTVQDVARPGTNAFIMACYGGCLDVAKWLAANFGSAAVCEEASPILGEVFWYAKQCGYTEMAQWLTACYGDFSRPDFGQGTSDPASSPSRQATLSAKESDVGPGGSKDEE